MKILRTDTGKINTCMKVYQVVERKPTKAYCKNTPKSKMGISDLSSCKSRGLVARDGKKSHKLSSGKRVTVGNRKIKGARYGGPLPDYS